jgi:hypothetical protein
VTNVVEDSVNQPKPVGMDRETDVDGSYVARRTELFPAMEDKTSVLLFVGWADVMNVVECAPSVEWVVNTGSVNYEAVVETDVEGWDYEPWN